MLRKRTRLSGGGVYGLTVIVAHHLARRRRANVRQDEHTHTA